MNIDGYHFNKKAHVIELWTLILIELFVTTINPIGFPYGFKSKNNLLLNEVSQNSIKCTCEIGISMKSVVAYFNFSKLVLHFGFTNLPTSWSEKSTWASCGVNLDIFL
jgi:nitrate reductase gamma subunit